MKKNELIYTNKVMFVYDKMPKHEELNSFGSPPQSRYTTMKKDIESTDRERSQYEEWLKRVRLFILGKWSQKENAVELDEIMNEHKTQPTTNKTNQTYLGSCFSLFANNRNKWAKADRILGCFILGFFFLWGVIIIFST